jgi:hypothetical protein
LKKKRKNRNKAKRFVANNVIKKDNYRSSLYLSILALCISIAGMLYFSEYSSEYQYSTSGVDILSNCNKKVSTTVGMSPVLEDGYTKLSIHINDFEKITKFCHKFTFIIPGESSPRVFSQLPSDNFNQTVMYNEIPSEMVSRSPFGYTAISIDMKKYPDFEGNIFTLINNIDSTSFSEFEFNLQFYSVNENGDEIESIVEEFIVSMSLDSKYTLTTDMSAISAKKIMLNQSFYWFEVSTSSPLIKVLIEDKSLSQWKTIFFNISIVLFGLAITALFNSIRRRYVK